eukprot:GEMP01061266.1.p1 GENE.GEMP01061266.1~~GEMP01061266.1.p1  ORF type:complete len:206 (+),score=28.86 GEMP01061266.1:138-755(+)
MSAKQRWFDDVNNYYCPRAARPHCPKDGNSFEIDGTHFYCNSQYCEPVKWNTEGANCDNAARSKTPGYKDHVGMDSLPVSHMPPFEISDPRLGIWNNGFELVHWNNLPKGFPNGHKTFEATKTIWNQMVRQAPITFTEKDCAGPDKLECNERHAGTEFMLAKLRNGVHDGKPIPYNGRPNYAELLKFLDLRATDEVGPLFTVHKL